MQYTVAFYIHHHGSGHLMTALAIAEELTTQKIVFLGSGLERYKELIPDRISCIHLPLDVPTKDEMVDELTESCKNFLYAPPNVKGIRERNKMVAEFFVENYPLIFIVDSSPEMVAFGRLCSVPTVVIQQHGERNDLSHLLSYDNAVEIIAPFPKSLRPDNPEWVYEKTFYAGGFSRFDSRSDGKLSVEKFIGVLVGSGGTSINNNFISHLASSAPSYCFKVFGSIDTIGKSNLNMPNIIWMGFLKDPIQELSTCKVIIGNAGHNTVMEMASLNKRFVCIPEERPFFEQRDKANKIEHAFNVPVVLPDELYTINWDGLLDEVAEEKSYWEGMINLNAAKDISDRVESLALKFFKKTKPFIFSPAAYLSSLAFL